MLADQGITSVGNFATANVLARFLLPESEFGAYGLILETMFFLNSLQAALVTYPLTIEAATKSGNLRRTASAGLFFTLMLLPVLGTAIWNAGAGNGGLAVGFAAAAVMVFWQLQETLRRGLIADMRIIESIPGDAISYLGQAAGVFALHLTGRLTLLNALLVIAGTSAAAIAVQALQVGVGPMSFADFRELAARFWRIGRWMFLTNITTVVTSISFPWLLRIRWGLDGVAVLVAITLPIKLVNPIFTSIGGLMVPAVARAISTGGIRPARRAVLRYGLFGAVLLSPFFLVICLAPVFVMKMIYGHDSEFVDNAPLLRLWATNCAVSYVSMVLTSWLVGMHESRLNFIAQVIHTAAALVISLPATFVFGIEGMVLGVLCATCIEVLALLMFLRRAHQHLVLADSSSPALATYYQDTDTRVSTLRESA